MIKKASHFVSFKFGDVQLPDIMNFLGGATSLDSFLKAYKTAETKGFFPYEWFDCPQKMNNSELPPYDAFFSKLRNVNPEEEIEGGNKKREMDQMRKQYIKEKGYNVVEIWECEWWNL